MRVMFVIVLERQCEITHRGRRIGFRHEGNVIALHGFDKALSHPVALRTAHRCRYRFKPDLSRKCPRLTRQVRTAVVGEPLNRLLRKLIAKTLLDGCQHDIADDISGVSAGGGLPAHCFPIAAIQRKGRMHRLVVVTAELEAI